MNISFDGIGEVIATFAVEADAELAPGDAVVITGDGEVGLGSDGGQICGVAVTVAQDGYAGVQIGGLARVRYSGTVAPAVGWDLLSTDGAGGVKAPATGGAACLVVSVDEEAETAVIKL